MKSFNFNIRKIICLILLNSIAAQSIAAFSLENFITKSLKPLVIKNKLTNTSKLKKALLSKYSLTLVGTAIGIISLIALIAVANKVIKNASQKQKINKDKLAREAEANRLRLQQEKDRLARLAEANHLRLQQEKDKLAREAEANRLRLQQEKDRLARLAEANRLRLQREKDRLAREAEANRLRLQQEKEKNRLFKKQGAIENRKVIENLNIARIKKVNNIDKTNENGETKLYTACKNEDIATVEILIKNGADVNKASINGITALFVACAKNNEKLVEILLANGAEKSIPKVDNSNGNTPFHIACLNGNQKIAEMLLRYKNVEINKININGKTPLDLANIGLMKINSDISDITRGNNQKSVYDLANQLNSTNEGQSLLISLEKFKNFIEYLKKIGAEESSVNCNPKESLLKDLPTENLYSILKIKSNSKAPEINLAYRKIMLRWHPDLFQDPKEKEKAETISSNINKAKEILLNTDCRKEYDETHKKDNEINDKEFEKDNDDMPNLEE